MGTQQRAATKTLPGESAKAPEVDGATIETPVCSAGKTKSPAVSGPAWSPCVALDTDCSVGVSRGKAVAQAGQIVLR